jgi:hypothetical protein
VRVNISTKEKKLLGAGAALFILYFLPFYLAPVGAAFVRGNWEHYQSLKSEILRYQRLHEQTQIWQAKHSEALAQQALVEEGVLQGSTRDLVAARLQSILKTHAQTVGIQVKALDVPEFVTSRDWLLVTQTLHFQANSQGALDFLQALKADKAFLQVVDLDLRTYATNQLNGRLKVTGFSVF